MSVLGSNEFQVYLTEIMLEEHIVNDTCFGSLGEGTRQKRYVPVMQFSNDVRISII